MSIKKITRRTTSYLVYSLYLLYSTCVSAGDTPQVDGYE